MIDHALHSMRGLANAAVAAFTFVVIADLAEWDAVLRLYALRDLMKEPEVGEGHIVEVVHHLQDVEAFRRFVVITATVLFLVWVHRSYRNLHRVGGLRVALSPGVAVSMFFIPILNLVMPYQVMSEAWRGSRALSRGPPVDERWKENRASPLIAVWWLALLLSGSLRIISGIFVADAAQSEMALRTTLASPGAVLADLVSAVLAIWLVRSIARYQESARSSGQSAGVM